VENLVSLVICKQRIRENYLIVANVTKKGKRNIPERRNTVRSEG
jgi:hypothetical protein